MNKKYTPQRWKPVIDNHRQMLIVDDRGFQIGSVNPNEPSAISNHQLISAAPDLVEALIADAKKEAELQNAPNVACGMDPQCFITWEDCLSELATTALTKAGVLTKDK